MDSDEGPHPLDLEATLKRMEPGVSPIQEVAITSLAISMKRIADNMETMAVTLENIRYAVHDGSNRISNAIDRVIIPQIGPALNRIADQQNIMITVISQMAQKGN